MPKRSHQINTFFGIVTQLREEIAQSLALSTKSAAQHYEQTQRILYRLCFEAIAHAWKISLPFQSIYPLFRRQQWIKNDLQDTQTYNELQLMCEQLSPTPHILGELHEFCLGQSLTQSARSSKRKTAGAYFTPELIRREMLQQTLMQQLDAAPGEAKQLQLVDPSCGGGFFLLDALDELVRYYQKQPTTYTQKGIPSNPLSLNDRLQILQRHIYGVDLDPLATEVTRLSLFLQLLLSPCTPEHEEQTLLKLPNQKSLVIAQVSDEQAHKIMQQLSHNIQTGNALIASSEWSFSAHSAGRKEKPAKKVVYFDWSKAFPEVFSGPNPGFSLVIGNPPYLNLKRGFLTEQEKEHFAKVYKSAQGQYDAFVLFMERAIQLLKEGGHHAFILPKPILVNEHYEDIRRYFLTFQLKDISDCGKPFGRTAVEAVIIHLCKRPNDQSQVHFWRITKSAGKEHIGQANSSLLVDTPNTSFSYLLNDRNLELFAQIRKHSTPLQQLCTSLKRGLETGKKNSRLKTHPEDAYVPVLRGEDIQAYTHQAPQLHYKPSPQYKREWKNKDIYTTPHKLVLRRVSQSIQSTIIPEEYWFFNTIYALVPKVQESRFWLLACLNSKVLNYYYQINFMGNDKIFPYIRMSQLHQLPIPTIHTKAQRAITEQLTALVQQRLLQPEIPEGSELCLNIEKGVCQLYQLSEDDIAFVQTESERVLKR